MTIAQTLAAARAKSGMTQTAVASALGVHWTTVARWEQGQRMPTILDLIRYAAAVGVKPGELVDKVKA
jgi:transcriptional regulator with XRE-family HTH domain